MKKKRKPSRTRWRISNWCPHKRFQNPHSWRRLERREERVRQHYENKGTPRARWINTGRPCRGPARKPNHQQLLHLLQLCWIWVCFIDAKERCNITRFQDALVCGFNHGKPRALRQEGERRFSATHHDLDLAFAHLQVVLIVDVHPLQGAAHPLVHSHQEHNCKSTWRV